MRRITWRMPALARRAGVEAKGGVALQAHGSIGGSIILQHFIRLYLSTADCKLAA